MEYGDIVIVVHPKHLFFNYTGKVVGRRGKMADGNQLLLVLINSKPYIIPESMLSLYENNKTTKGH